MGKVYKFADNIDTDAITSAKWASFTNPADFAAHCFETIRPDFASSVKEGDFVVAGENFGCGSSRERAPMAIKACGVKAVIAKSYARIFFRNAINIGFPLLVSPDLPDVVAEGDELAYDAASGIVTHKGKKYPTQPFPPFVQELIAAGGIMEYYLNVRGPRLSAGKNAQS